MTARSAPTPQAPMLAPSAENLQRLVMLRYLMVAAMAVALAVASPMDVAWEPKPMAVTLGLMVAANMATHWRARRAWPVANSELLGQLLLDVIALTALLYWSGGSGNPLVSLYLIPVVVAAAALPAAHTWFMAALTVGCYSWLILTQRPLTEHQHHGAESSFLDFHLTGMWLTFALSAALVALFVGRMASSLRDRDRRLAAAREESLRNERIVALGTMAAGAAHELGTPLGTLALLADELEPAVTGSPQAAQDVGEMRRQIGICKRIISDLLASAGQARGEGGSPQTADNFLREVVSKWEMMRPSARFDFQWKSDGPEPAILAEQTLSQAVINLLNNAADASPEHIDIEGRCVEDEMVIEIRDQGPGLTPEVLSRAGQPFFTTKGPGKGSGLGLFLANATIERFGGTVRLFNREGGGACTEVRLPLEPLLAEARR